MKMKKSIFSILLAFFCMIAIAQPGNNGTPQLPAGTIQPKAHCQPQGHQFNANESITLMVCSPNNERFWLYVNDQLFTRQSVFIAKVNLNPNFIYSIKVLMDNRSRDMVNENLCLGGNGDAIILTVERSQSHGRTPGHYRLRWNGQKVNPGDGNYAYIWMYKNDPRGVRYSSGMDIFPIVPPAPQPTPQPNYPGHPGAPQHPQQPNVQTPPQPQPCPSAEFQRIKSLVRDQKFEKDRMNVALQAIRGKLLTADQIADLARLFAFESDRLNFLKSAYDGCFDKNNYFVVYQTLEFSSSKDELTRFLQGR